jgi:hypothetical protein
MIKQSFFNIGCNFFATSVVDVDFTQNKSKSTFEKDSYCSVKVSLTFILSTSLSMVNPFSLSVVRLFPLAKKSEGCPVYRE